MDFKLRPWTINDLDSVTKNANNVAVSKFMSDGFPDTINKWKTFIDFAMSDDSKLYLAIDIDGLAVGGIGVSPQKDIMKNNAELGYWLSESYWGQGVMYRAVQEIVILAFDRFDINRIFATPFETNIASHKVLEKAGFKLEARFEKIVTKNGELLDELVYAIRR